MNIFQKVTLKSLIMNRTRTIVTIIGIILSAAMITAVTTLISSLQDYMLDNAIYVDGDWHGAFFDIDRVTAEEFGNDGKIHSAAFADNIGYADIGSSNEYKPYLFIMGADDMFLEIMPIHLVRGELPMSPDEIILPVHLASNGGVLYETGDVIQLEVGDRYFSGSKLMQDNPYIHPDDVEDYIGKGIYDSVQDEGADGHEKTGDNAADREAKGEELVIRETRSYTVVGFYERPTFEDYSAPGYTAITKMDFTTDSESYAVYFKMNNPKETFEYVGSSDFRGATNNDVLIYSGASKYDNFYSVLYSLAAILIGLIMFGSVSLIYNAFAISVSERTRQFGLLASIGATKRQSRKMVLFEALVVSSIGIPVGILSGIIGIGTTLNIVGDKFYAFYGSEGLILDLDVSIESIVAACIIALITVLISAWIPSRRATKVAAIDAIRLSNDINVRARNVKTSKLIYKLFGLEGMIARKYFKRNKRKYRATVVSLFMSTVLFISASSFCTYLTDAVSATFQDSDYDIVYHYAGRSEEDISFENLKTIHSGLSAVESVTSSSYAVIRGTTCSISTEMLSDDYVEYFNLPEETAEEEIYVMIYGIGDDVYRQYLKENNFSEELYLDKDNLRGLAQAVISKFDTSLQKYVTIPIFKDTSVTLNYEDYDYKRWTELTNEEQEQLLKTGADNEYKLKMPLEVDVIDIDLVQGLNESYKFGVKIMYPMSVYMELFDADACIFYFQTENPGLAYKQLEDYLMENGMEIGEYTLINVYEMSETDRNMVTIIKVFSYGFIILISLIALANVFNTISTNIMLRRREFAMLKSVGMTSKGFNKMMNFECILYGFKSLMWGIPAAFGVTWLIYQSLVRGYDTNFYLPWAAVVVAICSVFVVVFATMVYSMNKIKKDNPIDALKNENL